MGEKRDRTQGKVLTQNGPCLSPRDGALFILQGQTVKSPPELSEGTSLAARKISQGKEKGSIYLKDHEGARMSLRTKVDR